MFGLHGFVFFSFTETRLQGSWGLSCYYYFILTSHDAMTNREAVSWLESGYPAAKGATLLEDAEALAIEAMFV